MAEKANQKEAASPRQRPKKKGLGKMLRRLSALFILGSLLTLWAVSYLLNTEQAQHRILQWLHHEMNISARVAHFSFSWFNGLCIEGLSIANPEQFTAADFVKVKQATLNWSLTTLLQGVVNLDITLQGASLQLEQGEDGLWNWEKLFITGTEGEEGSSSDNSFILLMLRRVTLDEVEVFLAVKGKEPLAVHVAQLKLQLAQLPLNKSLSKQSPLQISLESCRYRTDDLTVNLSGRTMLKAELTSLDTMRGRLQLRNTALSLSRPATEKVTLPLSLDTPFSVDLRTTMLAMGKSSLRFGQGSSLTFTAPTVGAEHTEIYPFQARLVGADISPVIWLFNRVSLEGGISLSHGRVLITDRHSTVTGEIDALLPKVTIPEAHISLSQLALRGGFHYDTAGTTVVSVETLIRRCTVQEQAVSGVSGRAQLWLDERLWPTRYYLDMTIADVFRSRLHLTAFQRAQSSAGGGLRASAEIAAPDLGMNMSLPLRGSGLLSIQLKGKSITDTSFTAHYKSDDFYFIDEGLTSQRLPTDIKIKGAGNLMEGNVIAGIKGNIGPASLVSVSPARFRAWGDEVDIPEFVITSEAAALLDSLPPDLVNLPPAMDITAQVKAELAIAGSASQPVINGNLALQHLRISDESLGLVLKKGRLKGHIAYRAPRLDARLRAHASDVVLSGIMNVQNCSFELQLGNHDTHLPDVYHWQSTLSLPSIELGGIHALSTEFTAQGTVNGKNGEIMVPSAALRLAGIGAMNMKGKITHWSGLQSADIVSTDWDLAAVRDCLPLASLGLEHVILRGSSRFQASFRGNSVSSTTSLNKVTYLDERANIGLSNLDLQVLVQGDRSHLKGVVTGKSQTLLLEELRTLPYRDLALKVTGYLTGNDITITQSSLSLEHGLLTLSGKGTLTQSGSSYVAGLHTELRLDSPQPQPIMDDILLQGRSRVVVDITTAPDAFDVKGTFLAEKLGLEMVPSLTFKGITGQMPIRYSAKRQGRAKEKTSRLQLARLRGLYPLNPIGVKNNTHIDSLVLGNYQLDNIELTMNFSQGTLWVDSMACMLLQGKIAGSAMAHLLSRNPEYFLNASVTNVNFGLYSKKKMGRQSASMDSFLHLSGKGTELQGEYRISRISLKTIDNLLLSFDPDEVSPDILQIRAYLKLMSRTLIMHPHSMTFSIRNDNVYINIFLLPLGIQFKTVVPLSIVWDSLGIEQ